MPFDDSPVLANIRNVLQSDSDLQVLSRQCDTRLSLGDMNGCVLEELSHEPVILEHARPPNASHFSLALQAKRHRSAANGVDHESRAKDVTVDKDHLSDNRSDTQPCAVRDQESGSTNSRSNPVNDRSSRPDVSALNADKSHEASKIAQESTRHISSSKKTPFSYKSMEGHEKVPGGDSYPRNSINSFRE